MSEHVEVWRQPGGAWRWRFVAPADGGEPLVLPSNSAEGTCEEAVEAARTAYPGLPVVVDRSAEESGAPAARSRRRPRWVRVVLLVALLVAVRALRRPRTGGGGA